MSHEKVTALSLNKATKECWCSSYSNNDSPKTPVRWEMKGISEIYKSLGEEAAIKELLEMYWDGTFQPGAVTKFYKAVSIFRDNNPDIGWDSSGDILDEDLYFGPLEDLPKYLNVNDRRVQEIIKNRLNGVVYDRDTTKLKVVITDEDLLNRLYAIYKDYGNRVRGKFIIMVGTQFFRKACSLYRYYSTSLIEYAQVFDSREEALVFCGRHGLNSTGIINKEEL